MGSMNEQPTMVGSRRPSDEQDENVEMEDAEHEVDELASPGDPRKKKRRVIKTGDKKYECPQPDCGKSYSRAEHLYRHQLNHTPKQIYHCDFPGCDRHFVRADLCARHKERHTAKGSHLQRKDAFMHSQRAAAVTSHGLSRSDSGTGATVSPSPVDSHHARAPSTQGETYMPTPAQSVHGFTPSAEQYRSPQTTSGAQRMPSQNGVAINAQLGASYNAYTGPYHPNSAVMPSPCSNPMRRYSIEAQLNRPADFHSGYTQHQQLPMHPPTLPSPAMQSPLYSQQHYSSPVSVGPSSTSPAGSNYPPMPAPAPFGLTPAYGSAGHARPGSALLPTALNPMGHFQVPLSEASGVAEMNAFLNNYAMPVFGGDGFNRSPQSALDETLFNQLLLSGDLDTNNPPTPPAGDMNYRPHVSSTPLPKREQDTRTADSPENGTTWENISPTSNGMDLSLRESIVTERKQRRIIALVRSFEDIGELTGRISKEAILAGDTSDPNHPLSVDMLKTYITSFWIHIHQQMPIMHQPTFNAETCPDLLLVAICCLGACCLERTHAPEVIKNCSEFAFFAAYHSRWAVFKDVEFRPTAKLWTFQTMLLLELFEKMYSTRSLHERAHIHHATTLTVMRRGSSLIGRSVIESPSANQDITRTPPGPEGSINTSGTNTPDAWWNRWITAEATRRVAFAAFVIDSTHATLFGHSAVMSPHDIRLPLPCDEALWSATSSAEVQRVEASLAANGFKPTSFVEGLKRTLNGQKVRTNIFGRIILMAGLLNVSWHMNQRDLQISSLGANTTLGNPTRWRSPLTRAFDFWRRDFDESLSKMDSTQISSPKNKSRCHPEHRDSVFESRSCLHSLAHMAMHVDIVDCEVFAGSDRALGRVVTDSDRAAVQTRMREQWAPSARARDAAFYALRFLCEVLIPDEALNGSRPRPNDPSKFMYSARDDCLLNRPWILYFAALIVWSYGYALDGPIPAPATFTLTSRTRQIEDMQHFLIRIGGVASPDDLQSLEGRSSCLGLLLLLRDNFRQPRWELLHEASDMLQLCAELLLPGNLEVRQPLVCAPHT